MDMEKNKAATLGTNRFAPWQLHLKVEDDALAPIIETGAEARIDCSERVLVDGAIYAIREGEALRLWLFHEGFAGGGARIGSKRVGTLTSLGGAFRYRGPLDIEQINVVGRMIEHAELSPTPLKLYMDERRILQSYVDKFRTALRRSPKTSYNEEFTSEIFSRNDLDSIQRSVETANQDEAFSRQFCLEQQLDGLTARLMYVEDAIANGKVASLEDVRCKLQVLWELHYAPFPNQHDDIAACFIATTLKGVNEMVNKGDYQSETTEKEEVAPSPIQLVSSPRRRKSEG